MDILDELSQDIEANKEVIQEIHQNCLDFYEEAASQIVERLDYIHDEFYNILSIFNMDKALKNDKRKSSFDNSFVS